MDTALEAMLKQTVTRQPYLSRNDHNDYVWDVANISIFLAHIEEEDILIRNQSGQEATSKCQIYCKPDTIISYKDRISSPSFKTKYPEILLIDSISDETGDIYYKCIYTK